jgi:hypothetical protein
MLSGSRKRTASLLLPSALDEVAIVMTTKNETIRSEEIFLNMFVPLPSEIYFRLKFVDLSGSYLGCAEALAGWQRGHTDHFQLAVVELERCRDAAIRW